MATVNPPALYTGGAAVFNSQPIAQMAHQYAMKKIARDEALDDYFRNLNKGINPAGVRNQDIEGLTKKQAEWTQFYQQNKNAIKNPKLDNGKSYTEYQSRYQDMLNYVNQSKNASATSEQLAKARLNPNLGYMFDDDEVVTKIGEHDKPLLDPTRKELNIQELSIQPKPIDLKELGTLQKNVMAGLKPSEKVTKVDIDPATYDTITTTKKEYSTEDLQAIGNRWKSYYQFDRRVRNMADKNLFNAPNAAELSEIYQKTFGKPAENPGDLLAAQGILNAQSEGEVQKRTPGSLQQKVFLENMKQADRKELINIRHKNKQMDKQMENMWIERYMQSFLEDAKDAPEWELNFKGNKTKERRVTLDPELAKALKRGSAEPDVVTITPEGKIRGIFYKFDDKGNPIKDKQGRFLIDETLSSEVLSPDQVKLALSKRTQSATQRATEMSAGEMEAEPQRPRQQKGASPKKGTLDDL